MLVVRDQHLFIPIIYQVFNKLFEFHDVRVILGDIDFINFIGYAFHFALVMMARRLRAVKGSNPRAAIESRRAQMGSDKIGQGVVPLHDVDNMIFDSFLGQRGANNIRKP